MCEVNDPLNKRRKKKKKKSVLDEIHVIEQRTATVEVIFAYAFDRIVQTQSRIAAY